MSAPARTPDGARLDPAALARTVARLTRDGHVPWLHEEVARRMAERLPLIRLQPARVLDWSGPLGGSTALLRKAYPGARLSALQVGDALPPPQARQQPRWWPFGAARGAAVEAVRVSDLGDAAADLLWANMSLHAQADVPALFARWHRALDVGGFLMFSTLGPGSLAELRAVHQANGWGEPMAPFIDMHDLGDALVRAGFADPVMDQETVTLSWPDGEALVRELRGLGANLSTRRHAGCRTPRWRARWLAELTRRSGEARPTLSFELVYGHAFRAPTRARVQERTTISLDEMRAQVRKPGRDPA